MKDLQDSRRKEPTLTNASFPKHYDLWVQPVVFAVRWKGLEGVYNRAQQYLKFERVFGDPWCSITGSPDHL